MLRSTNLILKKLKYTSYSTGDTITNFKRLFLLVFLHSSPKLQFSQQKTVILWNLTHFHFYCLGILFIFQWWPFFSALLPWQNISSWCILCGSGMCRISCWPWLRCHSYGAFSPPSWLWSRNGRESRFLHGTTWC